MGRLRSRRRFGCSDPRRRRERAAGAGCRRPACESRDRPAVEQRDALGNPVSRCDCGGGCDPGPVRTCGRLPEQSGDHDVDTHHLRPGRPLGTPRPCANGTYTLESVATYPGGVTLASTPIAITRRQRPADHRPRWSFRRAIRHWVKRKRQYVDAVASPGVTKVTIDLTLPARMVCLTPSAQPRPSWVGSAFSPGPPPEGSCVPVPIPVDPARCRHIRGRCQRHEYARCPNRWMCTCPGLLPAQPC